ncbi:MarR family winged helix-turn-helix transcriptional regulator [Litorilituus lipolyticus]|uniref:MarR family transcriptional regulator n=1 Tax=Litorilituus lipolyticus TaxID=2491017 RepID=A0A502KUR5_9GAMM|nr:helix-turn-helix domain-containing protein [Litorilituus lipolyticus]TPH13975.1 MarR family transcriptional regulator [Litorilituus lipolyticus]
MTKESRFSNQIKSNYAFLAKSVFDLHCLIQNQSEELYVEKEMGFPVWASSALMFLASVKRASIMQISQALNLSHQLASQRIKIMLKLELVEGIKDDDDKRRTLYHLTSKGQEKSAVLDLYCKDAAQAFQDLSNEVGVDIQQVLNSAITALQAKSFNNRFPQNQQSYKQRVAIKNEEKT